MNKVKNQFNSRIAFSMWVALVSFTLLVLMLAAVLIPQVISQPRWLIGSVVSGGLLWLGWRNYKQMIEHDQKQQQLRWGEEVPKDRTTKITIVYILSMIPITALTVYFHGKFPYSLWGADTWMLSFAGAMLTVLLPVIIGKNLWFKFDERRRRKQYLNKLKQAGQEVPYKWPEAV